MIDFGHIRHLDVDYGEHGHERAVAHKSVYEVADKTLKVGLTDAPVKQERSTDTKDLPSLIKGGPHQAGITIHLRAQNLETFGEPVGLARVGGDVKFLIRGGSFVDDLYGIEAP